MKCIRVISQTKQVSFDREKVEKNLDTGIIGQHYNYTSSTMAQHGDFQQAMEERYSVQNMMQRNVQNDSDLENLDTFVGFTYNMPTSDTQVNNEDRTNNILYNMRSKRKKNVQQQQQYYNS